MRVIVPDRGGTGTNALLLRPPDAFDPSFGPGSLERHIEAASAAGIKFRVERVRSLMHDVDTPDDLADLGVLLDERRGVAPRTRGALHQLDHSQACGAAGAAGARSSRAPPPSDLAPRSPGLPEVRPGDDLAALLPPIASDEIVVVSHKVVSKAEGRLVDLSSIEPHPKRRARSARRTRGSRR